MARSATGGTDTGVSRIRPYAMFDIDDTTNVFMSRYRRWRAERFADLADDENIHDLLINRFIREADPSILVPTPGSRSALEAIARHVTPLAVSARDDDVYRHTYRLLEHHFPAVYDPAHVILIGHHNGTPRASKFETLEKRGITPVFIVEDNYRTASEFAQAGIVSFYIGTEGDRCPYLRRSDTYEDLWHEVRAFVESDYI